MIRKLIRSWRKRRQHERNVARFFALLEQETVAIRDIQFALAEVYADAQRMAAENQQHPED